MTVSNSTQKLPAGFSLRVATQGDIEAIMLLENECFGSEAWSRQTMLAEIIESHTHYLVLVDSEGAILGYGGLSKVSASERKRQGARQASHARLAI